MEIYRNDGHVLALLGAQHRHVAYDKGGISNHSVDVCGVRARLWKVTIVRGSSGSPVPGACGDDGETHATEIRNVPRGTYPRLH